MTAEDARRGPLLTAHDGVLLREGRPHRMLAGSVHYFRVHPDQWEDRLRRLAAMGLNTIDTYIPWNFHEELEGEPRFDGWRDVEAFIRLAGEIGFDVLVRPSPYICAEWSNGGLPAWLTGRTLAPRTSAAEFLSAVDAWYDVLIPRLAALQAAHGGPIVAVQVENEYGSFGSDDAYLEHLRDGLRARGIVEMLTTADGITRDMQRHGSVDGALGTFTFGTGVPTARELVVDGQPLICGELWGGWFDHWGEQHHVRSAESAGGTVRELLDAGGSVSLYMAHGGTNFGLWAGANHDRVLQPTITSYDSDAPVSEDGTVGAKFEAFREMFAPFTDGELPALPPAPRFQPERTVALTPQADLLGAVRALPIVATAAMPLTFEQLGVAEGLIAYEAVIDVPTAGAELAIDGLHDRATVFLDGTRLGTLERDGVTTLTLPAGVEEATLTIIVENLGRINYGRLLGERKGILEGVRVGRRLVHGWTHRALPTQPWEAPGSTTGTDGFAVATIDLDEPADAWLAFPGSAKGMVWINDVLIGRYWERGPQVTLYAPAPLWRAGANTVRVWEMDRLGTGVEVRQRPELGPVEEFIGS